MSCQSFVFLTVHTNLRMWSGDTDVESFDPALRWMLFFLLFAAAYCCLLVVENASDYAANTFNYLSVHHRHETKRNEIVSESYLRVESDSDPLKNVKCALHRFFFAMEENFSPSSMSWCRDGKIIHQLVNYIQLWSTALRWHLLIYLFNVFDPIWNVVPTSLRFQFNLMSRRRVLLRHFKWHNNDLNKKQFSNRLWLVTNRWRAIFSNWWSFYGNLFDIF